MRYLDEQEWRRRVDAHERRVDALVQPHLARREAGAEHPVEDFLYTYYSYRPAHLRRWHPGAGVVLLGDPPHARWRGYRRWDAEHGIGDGGVHGIGDGGVHGIGDGGPAGVGIDPAFVDARRATMSWIRDLLAATASRPAYTGCFGLHEWAMVYGTSPGEQRHQTWPLRLGHDGTDQVVESHQIRCSHADAFRFFTADARPHNTLRPNRERQVALEQPGCLHANMDVYKWAYKLAPLTPSELVVDAFVLARNIRELDMRASPYDLRALGYEPIRIETREGKAQYATAQRAFAEEASVLRRRLIEAIDQVDAVTR